MTEQVTTRVESATGIQYIMTTAAKKHYLDFTGTGTVTVEVLPRTGDVADYVASDMAGLAEARWRPLDNMVVTLTSEQIARDFEKPVKAIRITGTGTYTFDYVGV